MPSPVTRHTTPRKIRGPRKCRFQTVKSVMATSNPWTVCLSISSVPLHSRRVIPLDETEIASVGRIQIGKDIVPCDHRTRTPYCLAAFFHRRFVLLSIIIPAISPARKVAINTMPLAIGYIIVCVSGVPIFQLHSPGSTGILRDVQLT